MVGKGKQKFKKRTPDFRFVPPFPPKPSLPGPFSPRLPIASPLFQSPVLFDAFATFDSLSAAIAEVGASLDLATLLRSFCDVGASASPPQKFSQKEEETLRLGPFSPRPPVASPLFQSPVLSDAFAPFDSLSAVIAEASASLDLAILLHSFCDASTSALTPPPLPSPPQKSPQKEEETLRPGPFSPRPPVASPLFQSPILSNTFATFDSLSATITEAGASLDLATLLCCNASTSALTPPPLPSLPKNPLKKKKKPFAQAPSPLTFPPLPIPRPL